MKLRWTLVCLCFVASTGVAQIQIDLKFPRLQYISYEPVVANLVITNLAGRDVDLRDADGQSWFGFEVTGNEGRSIAPISNAGTEPLNIAVGKRVTRKINLTPLFGVHDFGTYRVRAHIYFADLNKFYYSQTKVFEVSDARPIWQKTVGVPEGESASGDVRTYSLMRNRFLDHTSLYVRVEDKDNGIVYATYSLGQVIAFGEPQVELDRSNQLHVLVADKIMENPYGVRSPADASNNRCWQLAFGLHNLVQQRNVQRNNRNCRTSLSYQSFVYRNISFTVNIF